MILSKIISGKQIFYIDSDDPVVSFLKENQLFGYHNWVILNNFIISSNQDSYIMDCGAHIGTFSFVPALFNNRRMILVDGAKKNTDCLERTFNGLSGVEIHNKILLDSNRKCSFNSDYGPFGSAKCDDTGNYTASTIDEIVGTKSISAIKLDIEGNEPEALLGAKKTIENNRPPMLIEVNGHCLRLQNKTPRDLFDILDSLNYVYFLVDGRRLITIEKQDIFPFCVIDIIAIEKYSIHNYTNRYEISAPIPRTQLLSLAKQNYEHSNQDCRDCFNSLNIF